MHDIRENRHFSRRVPEERIEEFHLFAQDFNSLLGEMEDWQRQLQAKNAQLLRSSLHDPLTGLANRAAFRNALAELMQNEVDHQTSALLFLDGDNFKLINDNWGHAAGDKVLMEVASRLMTLPVNAIWRGVLAAMSLPFCCARCARKQKCRPCARR